MVNDRLERGMRSVTEFQDSIAKLYYRKEKGETERVRHLEEEWSRDRDPGPADPADAGLQTQRYRRSAECQ